MKPRLTSLEDKSERLELIEQLEILKGELYDGNVEAAIEWIDAAIGVLERQNKERDYVYGMRKER